MSICKIVNTESKTSEITFKDFKELITFKELKDLVGTIGSEEEKSDFYYNLEYFWSEIEDADTVNLFEVKVDDGISFNGEKVLYLHNLEDFIYQERESNAGVLIRLNLNEVKENLGLYSLRYPEHSGYYIYERNMEIYVVKLIV